jgi:hypothetical protein
MGHTAKDENPDTYQQQQGARPPDHVVRRIPISTEKVEFPAAFTVFKFPKEEAESATAASGKVSLQSLGKRLGKIPCDVFDRGINKSAVHHMAALGNMTPTNRRNWARITGMGPLGYMQPVQSQVSLFLQQGMMELVEDDQKKEYF